MEIDTNIFEKEPFFTFEMFLCYRDNIGNEIAEAHIPGSKIYRYYKMNDNDMIDLGEMNFSIFDNGGIYELKISRN